MLIDIDALMKSLAKSRRIFHSEADFQHALAWEIHNIHPELGVRLEYRHPLLNRKYLDIWVTSDTKTLAIELKYWTRKLSTEFRRESFELLNQGAQDISRYDFLSDVQRLELLRSKSQNCRGVVIALTNEHLYWAPPSRDNVFDIEFRLHEDSDHEISGVRSWSKNTGKGTMRNRENSVTLQGVYLPEWQSFSDFPDIKNGTFRWLRFEV